MHIITKKEKFMKLFYFLFFVLLSSFACAQEAVPFPNQTKASAPEIPEDLRGLVWNKWNTKNFIIISIDKDQGLYLKNNIEKTKTWLITRWGLDDFDFTGDCKIVCVSNKELLKRIFKLENSKFEIRKNKDGKIQLSAIWFSLEDKNMPTAEIMKICLAEYGLANEIPDFCNQGMCFLSRDFEFIKNNILQNKDSILDIEFSKSMTDVQAGVVCLLMRKEYGQENFIEYLKKKNLSCYGFDNEEKFQNTLSRYCVNLLEDLKNNKTPKDYIKINRR